MKKPTRHIRFTASDTARLQAAAAALTGMMANPNLDYSKTKPEHLAQDAVSTGDLLIAEILSTKGPLRQ
jgi:hypothetical protein